MVVTLGVHDGHTATAAVARNGKILACISEERLNRQKEWIGFPARAITTCLEVAGFSADEIDGVGVVGLIEPTGYHSFQKPPFFKRLFGWGTHVLPRQFLQSDVWVKPAIWLASRFRKKRYIQDQLRALGITPTPVFYEHHFLHAATAHLTAWQGTKENLVVTCDGSGDGLCATVSIGQDTSLERIAAVSNYNSIGEFYTRITQHLGMKPMSHEYKIMGLAPYAKPDHASKTYDVIKDWYVVSQQNPLTFENRSGAWKWQLLTKLQRELYGHRFDNISWAAQTLTERLLVQWVKQCMKKTGISSVVLSGGVFMNVKANHAILSLPEVEDLFVFPSAGDESLAMGAALVCGIDLGYSRTEPLKQIYFGPEFDDAKAEAVLRKVRKKYHVEYLGKRINRVVGEELAQGKVVARVSGRMEWGARALGNRSILADPRDKEVVMKINEAVKMRDFWMPFAPSVLAERASSYLVNPKKFKAAYMTMAFPTRPAARSNLPAALHPYDFTARPQVVEKDWNPLYYEVLKSFERKTGIGGVLNTSFNLHGAPVVCSPEDALYTFENSALDALAIGSFYIERR